MQKKSGRSGDVFGQVSGAGLLLLMQKLLRRTSPIGVDLEELYENTKKQSTKGTHSSVVDRP